MSSMTLILSTLIVSGTLSVAKVIVARAKVLPEPEPETDFNFTEKTTVPLARGANESKVGMTVEFHLIVPVEES